MVFAQRTKPEQGAPKWTLSPERPDRIHVAFDDPRLVANAGLILPATLARRFGLGEQVDSNVDLGDAPGRANPTDKTLTSGDCIDDADVLRAGGAGRVLGCKVKTPFTPRLREGRLWGHSCAASGEDMCASWTG